METYFDSKDNNDAKKMWLKILVLGLMIFLAVTLVALFSLVGRARGLPIGSGMDVTLGPIVLMHIAKAASHQGGGFILEFGVKIGLMLWFVLSYIFAIAVVWGVKLLKPRAAKS